MEEKTYVDVYFSEEIEKELQAYADTREYPYTYLCRDLLFTGLNVFWIMKNHEKSSILLIQKNGEAIPLPVSFLAGEGFRGKERQKLLVSIPTREKIEKEFPEYGYDTKQEYVASLMYLGWQLHKREYETFRAINVDGLTIVEFPKKMMIV